MQKGSVSSQFASDEAYFRKPMNMNQTQQPDIKATTHYWGYRELSSAEVKHVSGGDEGGGNGADNGDGDGPGDGCDFAYGQGGGDGLSWPTPTVPSPWPFTWDGPN
jgi:hypothetical protein